MSHLFLELLFILLHYTHFVIGGGKTKHVGCVTHIGRCLDLWLLVSSSYLLFELVDAW